MILTRLTVDRFRNLGDISLLPASGINLILGANGAGKSSLLESIQCLSTGHSFRTRKPRELIAHGANEFLLTCEMQDPATGHVHRSGLARRTDGSVDLKFDFELLKSFQTVTQLLPVKALTPESHGLIQEGPGVRRQFVDWGVFHVEHDFMSAWRAFRRSLLQRNTALRTGRPESEVNTWDTTLVTSSMQIDAWRRTYVESLAEQFVRISDQLQLRFNVDLHYRSGWSEDLAFPEALSASADNNRRMKTTTVGPHRSELSIRSDGHAARSVLSRGQQKALVYALELAQLQLLTRVTSRKAIVLCDDLQAELDAEHLDRILDLLSDLGLQIFVTGTAESAWNHRASEMFHVEHGRIRKAVQLSG